MDLGACPKCCPREACKSGCGKPAFYTLDLGSFDYCSAECRDRCELERAKSEVSRALEECEVNPGGDSTKTPAKEPVSHDATPHVQPLTRPRCRSEDTPTIVGATCEATPTQQSPPPQEQRIVCYYKVSLEAVRAMSLYDSGNLQTAWGTKGVSSLFTGQVLFLPCSPICLHNYVRMYIAPVTLATSLSWSDYLCNTATL